MIAMSFPYWTNEASNETSSKNFSPRLTKSRSIEEAVSSPIVSADSHLERVRVNIGVETQTVSSGTPVTGPPCLDGGGEKPQCRVLLHSKNAKCGQSTDSSLPDHLDLFNVTVTGLVHFTVIKSLTYPWDKNHGLFLTFIFALEIAWAGHQTKLWNISTCNESRPW